MSNYGFRNLSTGIGKWLARDPVEEYGSKNLFLFVNNKSTYMIDPDGRWDWPWRGCCGSKPYNKLTQCCCCNGVLNGSLDCKIINRKPMYVGSINAVYGRDGYFYLLEHMWITWVTSSGDTTAGFYPDGIRHPDNTRWLGSAKIHSQWIMLSPCEYDFTKFINCLEDAADGNPPPGVYRIPWNVCSTWARRTVSTCIQNSYGCTSILPWL
jgi:hypothetical protein